MKVLAAGVDRVNGHRSPCVVTRHGSTAAITVCGETDLADVPRLEAAWWQTIAVQPTKIVVLDMSAVTFLDGAIAHWLVESHHRAASVYAQLIVVAPRGDARRVLHELDLGSVVTLVDPG